jgi:hypothetical protein
MSSMFLYLFWLCSLFSVPPSCLRGACTPVVSYIPEDDSRVVKRQDVLVSILRLVLWLLSLLSAEEVLAFLLSVTYLRMTLVSSKGKMFLYLFFALFSGFCPSFLLKRCLHSCCCKLSNSSQNPPYGQNIHFSKRKTRENKSHTSEYHHIG